MRSMHNVARHCNALAMHSKDVHNQLAWMSLIGLFLLILRILIFGKIRELYFAGINFRDKFLEKSE